MEAAAELRYTHTS